MADERGEAGRVFVADIEPVLTQLRDGGIHVPRVEEHEGVEDQSEGADLVLSELGMLTAWGRLSADRSLRIFLRIGGLPGVSPSRFLQGCPTRTSLGPWKMLLMDDAFTLLRRATDLLPEGAQAENGMTVDDVRDYQRHQEWELVLDLLMEIADEQPVSLRFWSLLEDAARQMMLEHSADWCEWRAGEMQHGTLRARLSLLSTEEGGRQTAFPGQGQLRPLWDIGNRAPDGGQAVNVARLWVEGGPGLAPGESATVRLAPLSPEQWRDVQPGDVITMHEGRPVVGTARIIEVSPPSVAGREGDL